jgi:hypothetical protein
MVCNFLYDRYSTRMHDVDQEVQQLFQRLMKIILHKGGTAWMASIDKSLPKRVSLEDTLCRYRNPHEVSFQIVSSGRKYCVVGIVMMS